MKRAARATLVVLLLSQFTSANAEDPTCAFGLSAEEQATAEVGTPVQITVTRIDLACTPEEAVWTMEIVVSGVHARHETVSITGSQYVFTYVGTLPGKDVVTFFAPPREHQEGQPDEVRYRTTSTLVTWTGPGIHTCASVFQVGPSYQALNQGQEATLEINATGSCGPLSEIVNVVVEGANPKVHPVQLVDGTGSLSYPGTNAGLDHVRLIRYGEVEYPVEAIVDWQGCPFDAVTADPPSETLDQYDDLELVVTTSGACGSPFAGVGIVATVVGANGTTMRPFVGLTDGDGEFYLSYHGGFSGTDEISIIARAPGVEDDAPLAGTETTSATITWTCTEEECIPDPPTEATQNLVDPPSADPWVQDAETIAPELGVTTPEALAYLQVQELIGTFDEAASLAAPDIFAGLEIEYNPYRMIVYSTDAGTRAFDDLLSSDSRFEPLRSLLFIEPADFAYAALQQAADAIIDTITVVLFDTDINISENKVKLIPDTVADASELEDAIAEGGHLLPPEAYGVGPDIGMVEPGAGSMYGGKALTNNTCTTGFSVRSDSKNVTGMATAGHCFHQDDTYYQGQHLRFVRGIYYGHRDVEWFKTPNLPEVPIVVDRSDDDTRNYRRIRHSLGRGRQSRGDAVCHFGRTTAYTCGRVSSRDYRPRGQNYQDTTLYGTFIQVCGLTGAGSCASGKLRCDQGDSGGPWYSGTTAFGIHHGHASTPPRAPCIYMAINYIQPLGIRVIHA